MKNILITGANGFIGKNLIDSLSKNYKFNLLKFDVDNNLSELENFIKQADFIVHLAGSNRPPNIEEYKEVNFGLTEIIIKIINKYNLSVPIIFASSTQAALDNPYGKSKLMAEELLAGFAKQTGNRVYIYRFTNVFGRWCRPNYNSVVATFCHNIAKDLPIQINNPDSLLKLIYVGDVIKEIEGIIISLPEINSETRMEIEPFYEITLGALAELIYSFKSGENVKQFDDLQVEFVGKMKETYEAYAGSVNGY